MNRCLSYRVHNKEFKVIPFTNYDTELLNNLQIKVNNYFGTEPLTKNYCEILILSGHAEGKIPAVETCYPELSHINKVWRNLNINYKKKWKEWQEVINTYLDPLGYHEGVFRLTGYSRVYVLITDYSEVERQVYKIHCGIEYLLIYLATVEETVMFHSCCGGFRSDDLSLFIGQSGAGKSTIAKKIIRKGGYVVDDERNFVVKDNKYRVFSGQNEAINKIVGCGNLESGDLKRILFIHQSSEEFIRKSVASDEIFNKIITANKEVGGYRETFPRFIKELNRKVITELLESLPVYELFLRKDSDLEEVLSDI